MKKRLFNLFFPHHGNNHRSRLLQELSLLKLVGLVVIFQLFIQVVTITNPGVLGYASNITQSDIVQLTNQKRASVGLQPLQSNEELNRSAKMKAEHMFAHNYWAHNAPDGTNPWYFFRQVDYSYLYAGENLARDFGISPDVVTAWMNSPTHRDNLLSGRYTEIGVAVVNGVLDGHETTLVVQHFGHPTSASAEVSGTSATDVNANGVKLSGDSPIKNLGNFLGETTKNVELNSEVKVIPDTNYFSSLDLTKSVNFALLFIIVLALIIDAFFIWRNGIVRQRGKSLIHVMFILVAMLILLLTRSGSTL